MDNMAQKTSYFTRLRVDREWYEVDAEGEVLGRLCSHIARLLLGKHKPTYTPGQDTGAFVVVVNADKIRLTAGKESKKLYYRHSGYPGGLRVETFARKLARKPAQTIKDSVRGMLPRNKLGDRLITKLKVYAGPRHPHKAQQPVKLTREQLHQMWGRI
ncbi:MAG: 50S ribosomal protein L13 [Planctomycetales bacterium 4484_113]|nr:MAG: 50S ribosomal protein L13 [Planctomycetales bacterium 4484_113]